jgi:hypothetical protein
MMASDVPIVLEMPYGSGVQKVAGQLRKGLWRRLTPFGDYKLRHV